MDSNIKKNVMRRVRIIKAVKPFMSMTAASFAILLVSLYEIGRFVFVAQVYRNMPAVQDIAALLSFFVAAFLNTEFIVQIFTILAIVALAFVANSLGRGVGRLRTV